MSFSVKSCRDTGLNITWLKYESNKHSSIALVNTEIIQIIDKEADSAWWK